MRHLTEEGWDRIAEGFEREFPAQDEEEFWAWAMRQGSAFKLAAYLIIGMLDGDEGDFPGFANLKEKTHPVSMAWNLDAVRRAMIADFLLDPQTYMH